MSPPPPMFPNILIRLWFNQIPDDLPTVLDQRTGKDSVNSDWRDLAILSKENLTLPERVVDDLKSGSVFHLVGELLEAGYVVGGHMKMHEVTMTNGGTVFRITVPFVHRSENKPAWRDQGIVDWVMNTFVGKEDTLLSSKVVVLIPRGVLKDEDAVMVNVMYPECLKEDQPLFMVHFDPSKGAFSIKDEDGNPTSLHDANLASFRFTADKRAENNAGDVANSVIKDGGTVPEARRVAHHVALAVFTMAEYTDEDAERRAWAVVDTIDWNKKVEALARHAARSAAIRMLQTERDPDLALEVAKKVARNVFAYHDEPHPDDAADTLASALPWEKIAEALGVTLPQGW